MASDESENGGADSDLEDKVKRWLNEQGYPTEFKAANVCSNHGFRVWQGSHVRGGSDQAPREIDVLAIADHASGKRLIRVEHVVECKWSRDKPWIVFTSPTGQMAPSACTSQTIANLLGSAAIWAIAGDEKLHSLDFFFTPERPGFGGRQAFSKGLDQFYSAVAATTELSFLSATENDGNRPHASLPQNLILTFPVVVVEGALFETYFDESRRGISLVARDRIRMHWRGASSWDAISTIDIVTLDHLDEFMRLRAAQVPTLLEELHEASLNIEQCFQEKSLRKLRVLKGPRGTLGVPNLLRDLDMLDSVSSIKKQKSKRKS